MEQADPARFGSLDACRRVLAREGYDPAVLLREIDELLEPVDGVWLVERLSSLWKSTTATSTMVAENWLVETGRLLAPLPGDIVAHSIDQAIRANAKGFTPTAGAILAIADPLHASRKMIKAKLVLLVKGDAPPAPKPWERRTDAPEVICTPAEAAAIIAEHGLDLSVERQRKPGDTGDHRPGRTPTAADYLAMGVAPETIAALQAERAGA